MRRFRVIAACASCSFWFEEIPLTASIWLEAHRMLVIDACCGLLN
jgi:hypothetical protein